MDVNEVIEKLQQRFAAAVFNNWRNKVLKAENEFKRHVRIVLMARFAPEVRLTGLEGEQLGIVSLREAIEKAEEAGVDLVEISPNAEPPVCRIMDYGKFLYEKSKSSRNRRRSRKLSVKEIKFRPVLMKVTIR